MTVTWRAKKARSTASWLLRPDCRNIGRRHTMATRVAITGGDRIKTITTHYIDGAFVESHGRETMDIISPTSGKLIGRVTLGDEEDTRRAIAAAKRAFATYGRSTKEERANILRRLHKAASARLDDLTA